MEASLALLKSFVLLAIISAKAPLGQTPSAPKQMKSTCNVNFKTLSVQSQLASFNRKK